MKARYISVGDVILVKAKPFLVKKVEFIGGKVIVYTDCGRIDFKPDDNVNFE